MLSRFLKSAKDALHVPPAEEQEKSSLQLSPVVPDAMVVTRLQSGDLPSNKDRAVIRIPSESPPPARTPKRKSRRASRSSSVEVLDYMPSTSKKRKTKAQDATTTDLEIRTRKTWPVVEIPAIDPIPASELSFSDTIEPGHTDVLEKQAEDGDDKSVILIESDDDSDDDGQPTEEQEEEAAAVNGRRGDIKNHIAGEEQDEDDDDDDESKEGGDENATSREEYARFAANRVSDRREHPQSRNALSSLPIDSHHTTLPDILPPELLQDDDISTAPRTQQVQQQIKPKKINFKDLVEKLPKDRRIGSTVYKVSKDRRMELAPKASWQCRSTKEAWIQGRTGKNWRKTRKPFPGGFFASKKRGSSR